MIDKEEILVGSEKVIIDSKNLEFNEDTLSDYIIKEGGYYDNFGAYLAKAEYIQQTIELEIDDIYNERFTFFKDQGMAVAPAESKAKSDPNYVEKRKELAQAKYVVLRLKYHLKAWDKNHDNAQSLGHNRRKEIEKLHAEIMMSKSPESISKMIGSF